MMFNNKIMAIKALREIPTRLEFVEAKIDDGYAKQTMVRVSPLGLKEAKDLVEGIMALGEVNATNRNNSLAEENAQLRHENTRLRDRCYDLQSQAADWKRIQELVEQLRQHTNPIQF